MQETAKITKRVLKLMRDFSAASLATIDDAGTPHVATVYCALDDDLNLYFTTGTRGQKYKNLSERPTVALVFTNEKELETVQLRGIATSLKGEKLEQEVLEKLWRFRFADQRWPMPPIKLYENGFASDIVVIKITPFEMTYGNFEGLPSGHYRSYFHKIL